MSIFGPPDVGKLRDNRDVARLIKALRYRQGSQEGVKVRAAAAEALGQLGDPHAVEPLVAALRDEFGQVCAAAAEALGLIGDPQSAEPLIAALQRKKRAVSDNQGSDWDQPLIKAAAQSLMRMGAPAVNPLVNAALKDKDRSVRATAAKILGQMGKPRAIKLLAKAVVKDKDFQIRRSAAVALGQMGDPRAVEPLLDALQDRTGNVRQEVTIALGQIGDPRAVGALVSTLRDDEWSEIRRAAADALGQIGEPRAVEFLIAALQDEDHRVRWRAAETLGSLDDPRGVEPLARALKDEDGDVRQKAAIVLEKMGDPRGVEFCTAALQNEDSNVRLEAVETIRLMGDSATRLLIRILADRNQDSKTRAAAAKALEYTDDRDAIKLLGIYGELGVDEFPDDWEVYKAAHDALIKIRKRKSALDSRTANIR